MLRGRVSDWHSTAEGPRRSSQPRYLSAHFVVEARAHRPAQPALYPLANIPVTGIAPAGGGQASRLGFVLLGGYLAGYAPQGLPQPRLAARLIRFGEVLCELSDRRRRRQLVLMGLCPVWLMRGALGRRRLDRM